MSMRYSEIIIFRRDTFENKAHAYRQTIAPKHGYMATRAVPFASLYKGHCDWIAADLDARAERAAKRAQRAA